MPTVKDVAKKAGVSIATVSRVLNNMGNPSDTVKKKVLEAARQIGYSTNIMAKSLKSGLTYTISIFSHSYYLINTPELIQSICLIAQKNNYYTDLILDLKPAGIISTLKTGKYDGAIIVDPQMEPNYLKALMNLDLNFVILGCDIERDDINTVDIDYFQAGYISTEKLISLGHKRILLLLDNPDNTLSREFKRGYLLALDENGIQYSEELIIPAPNQDHLNLERFGYNSISSTIENTLFSALMTSSNRTAIGAINALHKKGIKIPDQISFISMGNTDILNYTSPGISTVVAPFEQMGELGAEILLNNITRKDKIIKKVKLQVQFLDRGSTARTGKKISP